MEFITYLFTNHFLRNLCTYFIALYICLYNCRLLALYNLSKVTCVVFLRFVIDFKDWTQLFRCYQKNRNGKLCEKCEVTFLGYKLHRFFDVIRWLWILHFHANVKNDGYVFRVFRDFVSNICEKWNQQNHFRCAKETRSINCGAVVHIT